MKTVVIGRTLFFNQDHTLLLLRRSAHDVYRPGGIDLPGGAIEDHEDILAGSVREAQEETGLTVSPTDLKLVYAVTHADFNIDAQEEINMVGLFFACYTSDLTVTVNPEEHDAFYWYTLDEAIEKTDHQNHRLVFEHLRKHKVVQEFWR